MPGKANKALAAWLVGVLLLLCAGPLIAATDAATEEQGSAQVLQSFAQADAKESAIVSIEDETKRLIMFAMGVPLLILLLATVALGIAMGVYGKPVFVAHMVCAGLSLTLAIAHAVAGIVWFYPF